MFSIRQIFRLFAFRRGTKYLNQSIGIACNKVKRYLYKYVLSEMTAAEAVQSEKEWLQDHIGLKEGYFAFKRK